MNILIFGAGGMLGHKLVQQLSPKANVWGTLRGEYAEFERFGILEEERCITDLDVRDLSSVKGAIETARPDVVLNAVGVVKQLPAAQDVITTLTINSIFPHQLGQLIDEYGFRLITLSTDCVFSGSKGNYVEADPPDALDLYGRSKNFGEVERSGALTLRSSIIGRELSTAHSLVEWFLSNQGSKVKGFRNAIFSGFPTAVLSNIISDLIFEHRDLSGLYHASSEPINKYDLLVLLREHFGADIEIEPSDDVRIDRSLDSTRFRSATGFSPAGWPEMIEQMVSDPTPYQTWK
ncbi:MAG: dTDP-4-dehydrorhamnose reductase family protein [Pyrinomonadaceae bacterium]